MSLTVSFFPTDCIVALENLDFNLNYRYTQNFSQTCLKIYFSFTKSQDFSLLHKKHIFESFTFAVQLLQMY